MKELPNTADIGDTLAGVTALAAFTEVLPPIAAVLAILWTCIRIYEWFRFRVLHKNSEKQFS